MNKNTQNTQNIQMPEGYEFDCVQDGVIKLKKIAVEKFIVGRWYRDSAENHRLILQIDFIKGGFSKAYCKNNKGKLFRTDLSFDLWAEIPFTELTEEQKFLLPVKMGVDIDPIVFMGVYLRCENRTKHRFCCVDIEDQRPSYYDCCDYRDEE